MNTRRQAFVAAAVLVALCSWALAACGSSGSSGGGGASTAPAPKTERGFDPSNFPANPARGANRWHPMIPGRQLVKEGQVTVGHRRLTHRRVYTITDISKEIDGVRTVVILDQDFNGGQLSEQALDYQAEDKQGNVWYIGSYTEAYEAGQFVTANDAWLAGVKGAKPGILVAGSPKVGGSYSESKSLGHAPSSAKVIKTGVSKCVPFKCFKDVLVIQEGGGTSGGGEWKYYAPGVGEIKIEPHYSGGEQETEVLLNVTQLSPGGLSELSAEALKLDRHARSVVPSVFGNSAPAKRDL